MTPVSFSRSAAWLSVCALLLSGSFALGAGCGASGASGTLGAGGSGGAQASSSASSGGGLGGASSSSSGGGAGGAPGCMANTDCPDPKAPVCDTMTGLCAECLPNQDICPMGQFCTPMGTCAQGCTDQSDCTAMTVCDPTTNKCVGCVADADCPLGSICAIDKTCTPGCTMQQPCTGTDKCCSMLCVDVLTDVANCGSCGNLCPTQAQATPTCVNGMCGYKCTAAFLDCNKQAADGCEWNVLQDGPCLCKPGDTMACYNGAPGTQNIGVCKGGTKTCNPDGVSWGACTGEVLPTAEQCNGLDDDCNGVPEAPGCVPCVIGTGMCNGTVGSYCVDGLGYYVENCDPLEGLTCDPANGKCQGACSADKLGTSNIGCDYFPTVTANLVNVNYHFAVAVSNTSASAATVTVSKGPNTLQTVMVAANNVQIIQLPWDLALKGPASNSVVPMPGSVRVNQGAYRLRSTQPVSVYQFNPLEYTNGGNCTFDQTACTFSNDASMLLPTNVWTGTYRVAARHHFAGGSGFYAVVARDDGTIVNVTAPPSGVQVKSGVAGINTNNNGTVTLNAGDVIEIVTNGGLAQDDPNDVTGTLVSANKPVQVFGGHQCIYIPYNIGYCDHLEESMFPYETLSTTYIVTAPAIPIAGNPPKVEMVRIVATKPNTTLSYDPPQPGAPASIAQAGQWVEIANTVNDFQITASEPILVAQYMEGQAAGGNIGDPAMTLAVAKDQYRSSYLFHGPTNYSSTFMNITAPTGLVVLLDGAPVGGFTPIGNSGFSVARPVVSNAGSGNHTITGAQPFGITVYGYGQYTSYWYPGGTQLVKLHN